eukprot:5430800-Pleurochrysis_carterae.AAC.5
MRCGCHCRIISEKLRASSSLIRSLSTSPSLVSDLRIERSMSVFLSIPCVLTECAACRARASFCHPSISISRTWSGERGRRTT